MPNKKKDKIKIPKKAPKKMPVYSKVSGLDITKKGNQERTNDYTVNSSRTDKFYEEAERMGVTKKPNFSNLAAGGSAFKMKGKKKLKKVVKQLKGASKMHAGQAKVINSMIKNSALKTKPKIPMDTMAGEGNTKAFRSKEKARRGLGLTSRQLENDRYQQRKVTGKTNNQDGRPVPMKMKQSPMLKKLSAGCKAAARRKFDVYPSAYANMWASAQGRKGKC